MLELVDEVLLLDEVLELLGVVVHGVVLLLDELVLEVVVV